MTKNRKTDDAGFVVCLKNDGYAASLERHKIYRMLHDPGAEKDGDLRVIDESGEDYVYPGDWFVVIDLPKAVEVSFRKTSHGMIRACR